MAEQTRMVSAAALEGLRAARGPALRPSILTAFTLAPGVVQPAPAPAAPAATQPAPVPPAALAPIPPPPIPTPVPVGADPFAALPQPSPGDRIKADDFRTLSQALLLVQHAYQLSAALFGRSFGEVRLALAAQQYQLERVMSVFGTELQAGDTSLDDRHVVQVAPVALSARRLLVVLTEAVDTRRLTPTFVGKTYRDALAEMRNLFGGATTPRTTITTPQLVGLPLETTRTALDRVGG